MQAGKTGMIGAAFKLLKYLIPELTGSLVCGNDQTDLRSQNKRSLEYLGIKILSRKERKEIQKVDRPHLEVFEEAHCGDKIGMTCDIYFTRHNIKDDPNVIFLGVSATPFAAATSNLFHTIRVPVKELEATGYNSLRQMLRTKRIRESDPLFEGKNDTINQNANVYKHICEIMKSKKLYGYGLIITPISS